MNKRAYQICYLLLAVIFVSTLTSCRDVGDIKKVLEQNTIPGAKYVGIDSCAVCHEDIVKHYRIESHFGSSLEEGEKIKGEACESCHGPGSLHVDSGGDKSKIVRYNPEYCFACHGDVKAQFQLQYHHPLERNHVTCLDCHSIHKSQDVAFHAVTDLERNNEKCFKCHKEMKGPFVFEHDAVKEGCQTCHQPHGSVFNKLLVSDVPALCLRCHWEPNTNINTANIGGVPHGTGGQDAFVGNGVKCIDCHKAIHGSNSWKTLDNG